MWPDYVGSWGLTGHAQPVRRGLSLTRTGHGNALATPKFMPEVMRDAYSMLV